MRYALFIFAGCLGVYVFHRITKPNKQSILPPLTKLIGRRKDKQ